MTQEEKLDGVAERYRMSTLHERGSEKLAFVKGAKWQQKASIEILESIQKDLKEKFDNDPAIMRVANMIINEFKIRDSK